jgi:hypothetical protein
MEKRKYIKRDCSYWGHDNKVVGKGSLDSVGVTLLQCKRCDARTWSKGVTDTELSDLISMTLKDTSKQPPYNHIARMYRLSADMADEKNYVVSQFKSIRRKRWNLWKFWRLK